MATILDAMTDDNLFGGSFGGDSFASWRALLAGFYGLTLDDAQQEVWRSLTARQDAPQGPHSELWLAVGRRGGKSHAAALLGAYEACFNDHRHKLAKGEIATVMLLAADRKQARTLMRYIRGLMMDHPMLRQMVKSETAEGLELTNRTMIEVGTASHRSVRGYTCAAVICDEIAFWMADGASPDVEILAALRPSLATLGGKLIALSSPYARRGALWSTYRRSYGKSDPRVLVAQAPSRTMNPTLPQSVVDDAMREDAARAGAEYLAQFRSDIEQFLTVEIVSAAQRPKPAELPRIKGVKYYGFVDPAGGGADEFTLSIGHLDKGLAVVDLVRGARGNPANITGEFAEVCKDYGVLRVYGDRYAGEWPRVEFRKHGVNFRDAPGTRSELYLSLLAALNSGRVELPPCALLERQLVGLERRTTRGGRDMIDHAPGANDDRANACAGVVAVLTTEVPKAPTAKTGFVRGLY